MVFLVEFWWRRGSLRHLLWAKKFDLWARMEAPRQGIKTHKVLRFGETELRLVSELVIDNSSLRNVEGTGEATQGTKHINVSSFPLTLFRLSVFHCFLSHLFLSAAKVVQIVAVTAKVGQGHRGQREVRYGLLPPSFPPPPFHALTRDRFGPQPTSQESSPTLASFQIHHLGRPPWGPRSVGGGRGGRSQRVGAPKGGWEGVGVGEERVVYPSFVGACLFFRRCFSVVGFSVSFFSRCWLLKKCRYGTLIATAGWQHCVQKVGADSGLLSSSNCPCASGHSSRGLDKVVHGDDFIVAGCGDDLDRLAVTETE